MTAEIGILNKQGIALAADSAQTISNTKGGSILKVLNSADKLFNLSKDHSVGIMTFGNGTFMGVPWVTLISAYKSAIGSKKLKTFNEYSDKFLEFLRTEPNLLSHQQQNYYIKSHISYAFSLCREKIDDEWEKIIKKEYFKDDQTEEKRLNGLIKTIINDYLEKVCKFPFIESSTEEQRSRFLKECDKEIKILIKEEFEGLPSLPEDTVAELNDIVLGIFFRKMFLGDDSGIVIAGFGKEEMFPSRCCLFVDGIADNLLKYSKKVTIFKSDQQRASISAYAQKEQVYLFINGIDPRLEQYSVDRLKYVLDRNLHDLVNRMSDADEDVKRKYIIEQSKKIIKEYSSPIRRYKDDKFADRIKIAAAHFTVRELAFLAESLVYLTVIKRQFTFGTSTVCGPIDVAVITKDGFKWVKRKGKSYVI